ncbi:uncharacterized protein Z518_00693 [Rhinocladiella mackenziei CBS 650.93]|uniref:NTF2-like domain-containing protein n=1 Tax=Rhinocladiella mackenziei CBS 650.93 TaxID=1442369 RepID=A0A0D2HG43_9EURO|nr:uncharacterized protein Z518_00693 [Rhinocladiella mackenziei CBS 650.93]KIX09613.1 hypothetical protein Z518_00693 [Rhinocladiella mackenziei CBS 650.93]
MKLLATITFLVSTLSAVALASPQRGGGGRPGRPTITQTATGTTTSTTTISSSTTSSATSPTATCLDSSSAEYLVNGFASLLTAYSNATAEALLASNFTDTSDSINFLVGNPLGSVTFPSKAAFEAGQGSQPPIGFTILNIDAVTCDVIAFRWAATLGPDAPVKGINILYASNLNGTAAGWQVKTVYSEFNSGTWSQEIGGVCA